jgi:hypothetical protein
MPRFSRLAAFALFLAVAGVAAEGAAAPAPRQYLVITDPAYSGLARERMTQLAITNDGMALADLGAVNPETLRAGYRAIYLPAVADAADLGQVRSLVAVGGVLERFVYSGGTLVLVLTGYTGDQPDIAPGGVDVVRDGPHNVEVILTPTHPYFIGSGYGGSRLSRGSFGAWRHTDLGTLGDLPEAATVLLRNEDGASLVEYRYGQGRVIATTLSFGWPGFPARVGSAWNNLLRYGAAMPAAPPPVTGSTVVVEKVPPKITVSSRGPRGELLRTPEGKPLYRVTVTDAEPSSGLAEVTLEGMNYQVVAVNGNPVAALPIPYTDTFAPGSSVKTWELLLEKINLRSLGRLTVTAKDHAGNRLILRR